MGDKSPYLVGVGEVPLPSGGRGGPLVDNRSPYLVGVEEVPLWRIGPLT